MSFDTYDELQAEIQSYMDNDNANVVAAIPGAITLAESKLSRLLRTWEMEIRSAVPLVPDPVVPEELGYYDLPDDWGGHRSVVRRADDLLLLYWQRLPVLSDTNPDNWLLLKHPDAYLYGSLSELTRFAKNKEEASQWTDGFEGVMKSIQSQDWNDSYGRPQQTTRRLARFYVDSPSGVLGYRAPIEYDEIEAQGRGYNLPPQGVFTVSAQKIRIWPKPEDPTP